MVKKLPSFMAAILILMAVSVQAAASTIPSAMTIKSDYFGSERPVSLLVSGDGEFHIGTTGGAVYITDPGVSQRKTLSFQRIREDNAGNIWVALIANDEYTLLEMPVVRVLLIFFGLGVLMLCVRAFVQHRTKAVIRQRQEYKEITAQVMSVAAAMTDSRNEYTRGHSRRVAEYSKIVGKRLGMPEDELETLYYAAILHDIGNVSVPDSILGKKGRLTDEEYEAIKAHVTIGGELLREVSVIKDVALGAKYHHERVDGKGYAEGLSGDDIPLIAKIICVCNAFDSMLSDKPHRKAMSVEDAQSELIRCAGTQFDEKVTAILISLIHEGSVPL